MQRPVNVVNRPDVAPNSMIRSSSPAAPGTTPSCILSQSQSWTMSRQRLEHCWIDSIEYRLCKTVWHVTHQSHRCCRRKQLVWKLHFSWPRAIGIAHCRSYIHTLNVRKQPHGPPKLVEIQACVGYNPFHLQKPNIFAMVGWLSNVRIHCICL